MQTYDLPVTEPPITSKVPPSSTASSWSTLTPRSPCPRPLSTPRRYFAWNSRRIVLLVMCEIILAALLYRSLEIIAWGERALRLLRRYADSKPLPFTPTATRSYTLPHEPLYSSHNDSTIFSCPATAFPQFPRTATAATEQLVLRFYGHKPAEDICDAPWKYLWTKENPNSSIVGFARIALSFVMTARLSPDSLDVFLLLDLVVTGYRMLVPAASKRRLPLLVQDVAGLFTSRGVQIVLRMMAVGLAATPTPCSSPSTNSLVRSFPKVGVPKHESSSRSSAAISSSHELSAALAQTAPTHRLLLMAVCWFFQDIALEHLLSLHHELRSLQGQYMWLITRDKYARSELSAKDYLLGEVLASASLTDEDAAAGRTKKDGTSLRERRISRKDGERKARQAGSAHSEPTGPSFVREPLLQFVHGDPQPHQTASSAQPHHAYELASRFGTERKDAGPPPTQLPQDLPIRSHNANVPETSLKTRDGGLQGVSAAERSRHISDGGVSQQELLDMYSPPVDRARKRRGTKNNSSLHKYSHSFPIEPYDRPRKRDHSLPHDDEDDILATPRDDIRDELTQDALDALKYGYQLGDLRRESADAIRAAAEQSHLQEDGEAEMQRILTNRNNKLPGGDLGDEQTAGLTGTLVSDPIRGIPRDISSELPDTAAQLLLEPGPVALDGTSVAALALSEEDNIEDEIWRNPPEHDSEFEELLGKQGEEHVDAAWGRLGRSLEEELNKSDENVEEVAQNGLYGVPPGDDLSSSDGDALEYYQHEAVVEPSGQGMERDAGDLSSTEITAANDQPSRIHEDVAPEPPVSTAQPIDIKYNGPTTPALQEPATLPAGFQTREAPSSDLDNTETKNVEATNDIPLVASPTHFSAEAPSHDTFNQYSHPTALHSPTPVGQDARVESSEQTTPTPQDNAARHEEAPTNTSLETTEPGSSPSPHEHLNRGTDEQSPPARTQAPATDLDSPVTDKANVISKDTIIFTPPAHPVDDQILKTATETTPPPPPPKSPTPLLTPTDHVTPPRGRSASDTAGETLETEGEGPPASHQSRAVKHKRDLSASKRRAMARKAQEKGEV